MKRLIIAVTLTLPTLLFSQESKYEVIEIYSHKENEYTRFDEYKVKARVGVMGIEEFTLMVGKPSSLYDNYDVSTLVNRLNNDILKDFIRLVKNNPEVPNVKGVENPKSYWDNWIEININFITISLVYNYPIYVAVTDNLNEKEIKYNYTLVYDDNGFYNHKRSLDKSRRNWDHGRVLIDVNEVKGRITNQEN